MNIPLCFNSSYQQPATTGPFKVKNPKQRFKIARPRLKYRMMRWASKNIDFVIIRWLFWFVLGRLNRVITACTHLLLSLLLPNVDSHSALHLIFLLPILLPLVTIPVSFDQKLFTSFSISSGSDETSCWHPPRAVGTYSPFWTSVLSLWIRALDLVRIIRIAITFEKAVHIHIVAITLMALLSF